jgi:hypothetical protein
MSRHEYVAGATDTGRTRGRGLAGLPLSCLSACDTEKCGAPACDFAEGILRISMLILSLHVRFSRPLTISIRLYDYCWTLIHTSKSFGHDPHEIVQPSIHVGYLLHLHES